MSGLDERLSDFRENCGDRDLVAFLDRHYPRDKESFIKRLYDDIHTAIADLESLAHQLVDEGENALRSRLLTVLKTHGYHASGETDHRGHTDLLVESAHVRLKWIGEAKRHEGSAYEKLTKGMRQLYSRYMSGIDRDSGFIVFVFNKNAADVVDTWKATIEQSDLCGLQGSPRDEVEVPLCFWTEHIHEGSGLPVRTKHIFAALYYRPQDAKES